MEFYTWFSCSTDIRTSVYKSDQKYWLHKRSGIAHRSSSNFILFKYHPDQQLFRPQNIKCGLFLYAGEGRVPLAIQRVEGVGILEKGRQKRSHSLPTTTPFSTIFYIQLKKTGTILLMFNKHILQFFWWYFVFFIVIVHVFSTEMELWLLFFIHFVQW